MVSPFAWFAKMNVYEAALAADTHPIIIVKSRVGVNQKALKTQGFCGILSLTASKNSITKEAFLI